MLIYSPNGGLSKILLPEYEKLAEKLYGFDGLQIAKIDGHLNQLEGIQFYGFPSVKFIRAHS